MENQSYSVYVKTDEQGRIIAINSSAFLPDLQGWSKIDTGEGDPYRHAQGNYLPLPLRDEQGICRYRLEEGCIVPRTPEEMAADLPKDDPDAPADTNARLAALEEQLEMLLEGATEDE